MNFDQLGIIYANVVSAIFVIVGILTLLFTNKFLKHNQDRFLKLYKKTNLIIFKKQADGMAKPYMKFLAVFIAAIFTIVGFLHLVGFNIFQIP